MEVFPFPLCQVSGLSHWCVHPGEGGSEEQSQWSQCPPGLWTMCLVLLSVAQQWQDRTKMDVTAQGSCCWLTPVFLQGREHRTVPSCHVPGWGLAEG